MYKDISTQGLSFPKTLVIRNRVGGSIWQIYHVDNPQQVYHLAQNAENNGYEGITLEDRRDDEETFPNWRMEMARQLVNILPNHLVLKEEAVDVLIDDDLYEDERLYDSDESL